MRKLSELGISPAPWEYVAYKNEVAIVTSGGFDDLRSAHCRGMNRIANARLIAALLASGAAAALIACRDLLRAALAEAAGEEVSDGKAT